MFPWVFWNWDIEIFADVWVNYYVPCCAFVCKAALTWVILTSRRGGSYFLFLPWRAYTCLINSVPPFYWSHSCGVPGLRNLWFIPHQSWADLLVIPKSPTFFGPGNGSLTLTHLVVLVVVLGLMLFEKSLRLLHFIFKFLQISSHNPL